MSDFSRKASLARAGAPDLTGGHGADAKLPDYLQNTGAGLRCSKCGAEGADVEDLIHKDDCPYAG